MINARNKVPEHQKFYQTAYANHQRLWKIVRPRRIALHPSSTSHADHICAEPPLQVPHGPLPLPPLGWLCRSVSLEPGVRIPVLTLSGTTYMGVRKVLGHNTWFGEN